MSSDEVASSQKLRVATKFVLEDLLALDLLAHRVFHTSANTIHALIECKFIVCELVIVIERHKVSEEEAGDAAAVSQACLPVLVLPRPLGTVPSDAPVASTPAT